MDEWEVALATADSCQMVGREACDGCFPGENGLWELSYRGPAAATTVSSLHGQPLLVSTAFCSRLRCRGSGARKFALERALQRPSALRLAQLLEAPR